MALAAAGCANLGVTSGPSGRGVVALTFDDGPSEPWTAEVLRVLKDRGARATFFVVGRNVERRPDLARRILAEGHEIGNHTLHHFHTWAFWPSTTLETEARGGEEAIAAATGVRPRLLRWPVGVPIGNGDRVRFLEDSLDCVLVGYTGAARDTAGGDPPEVLAERLLADARDGAILALHDGNAASAQPNQAATVAALSLVLDGLRARGLRTVTVSELLGVAPYRDRERPEAEAPDRASTSGA